MIIGISGKIGSGKDTVGKIIQYFTRNDYPEFHKWQIKKFAYKLKQCVSIITGIPIEDLEKEEVKNSYLGEEWNYTTEQSTPKRGGYMDDINRENIITHFTVRKFLQLLGTEVGRQIHLNTWVNALFSEYNFSTNNSKDTSDLLLDLDMLLMTNKIDYSNKVLLSKYKHLYPNWIITDCRFPNEAKAIKDRNGIIIRVNRKFHTYSNDLGGTTTVVDSPFTLSTHPSEIALDNYTFDYTIDNNGTIEELIEQVKTILIKEKII